MGTVITRRDILQDIENSWITRARELVQILPQLGLQNFNFNDLIPTLSGDNSNLLSNSVNRLFNNDISFDFGARQLNINNLDQNMNLFFSNNDRSVNGYDENDGEIIETLEMIAQEYPQLNPSTAAVQSLIGGRKYKTKKRIKSKKINKKFKKISKKKKKK